MKNTVITLIALLMCQGLFAWGQNGHRIVAQICYNNLDATTRAKIDNILKNHTLSQIATWPDFIRSDAAWEFSLDWHFVTVAPGKTTDDVIAQGKNNPEIENVIEAIELMQAILAGDKAAIAQFQDLMDKNNAKALDGNIELTALAFLVHFIGDVHQPMHVGKGDDAGGNFVKVLFFNEASNLHSVWDEGIIEKEQLSFTEFSNFVETFYKSNITQFQSVALPGQWAQESVQYRNTIYKNLCEPMGNVPCKPDFSYQYAHDFLPTIQERLGAAGFRAAKVLEDIF